MSKARLYPEEQTHAVAYHDESDGESYEGMLSFGGGWWARLSFRNNAPVSLAEGQRIGHVKVQSELGKRFTLCECQTIWA
jgi:hypothetical protein